MRGLLGSFSPKKFKKRKYCATYGTRLPNIFPEECYILPILPFGIEPKKPILLWLQN